MPASPTAQHATSAPLTSPAQSQPLSLWEMRPMPAGAKPVLATASIPLADVLTIETGATSVIGDALVDRAIEAIRLDAKTALPAGLAVYGAEVTLTPAGFVVTLAYLDEDLAGGAIAEIFAEA